MPPCLDSLVFPGCDGRLESNRVCSVILHTVEAGV